MWGGKDQESAPAAPEVEKQGPEMSLPCTQRAQGKVDGQGGWTSEVAGGTKAAPQPRVKHRQDQSSSPSSHHRPLQHFQASGENRVKPRTE